MKKPGLMLAFGLSKSKKPVDEEPEDDDSGDEEGDFDDAASEVMDALKSQDVEAFKTALKLAIMSCQSEY